MIMGEGKDGKVGLWKVYKLSVWGFGVKYESGVGVMGGEG